MKKWFTRKWLLIPGVLLMVLAILIPTFVYALPEEPGNPDVDGFYLCKANIRLTNMDGVAVTPVYRYIGLTLNNTEDVVTGELAFYLTNTAKGSLLSNMEGIATGAPVKLALGVNTITDTTYGTFNLHLPTGITAIVTSGTTTVASSPKSCTAGDTTITTSGSTGDFTVTVALAYTVVGDVVGVVGEGYKPRFQLIGTTIIGSCADSGGNATGSPIKCTAASTTITVTKAGTFDITMPNGVVATATTGSGVTITNSPKTCVAGATTTVTATGTGTFTVEMRILSGYVISGRIGLDKLGDVSTISGFLDGFYIADNQTWNVLNYGSKFSGKWEALD